MNKHKWMMNKNWTWWVSTAFGSLLSLNPRNSRALEPESTVVTANIQTEESFFRIFSLCFSPITELEVFGFCSVFTLTRRLLQQSLYHFPIKETIINSQNMELWLCYHTHYAKFPTFVLFRFSWNVERSQNLERERERVKVWI